LVFIFLKEPQY